METIAKSPKVVMLIEALEGKKGNKKEDLTKYLEILKIILSYSAISKKVGTHFVEFNKRQNLSANIMSPSVYTEAPHHAGNR